MKNINYILLFALFTASVFLISSSLSFDAQTGNKQFDEKLNDINEDALADLKTFKSNIAAYYTVDRAEVSNMLAFMEPAEIILTFELARSTNKSVAKIINHYHKNKRAGWNQILLGLGIRKNSQEFKDLSHVELNDIYKHENVISKK